MDFFERHKALIITVLLFSVLLLAMININISNANKKVRETLIELNDLRPEETKKQEPKLQEQKQTSQRPPTLKTHQAFNQDLEESQRKMQSRLDEIFEKNAAEQKASETDDAKSSSGDINLTENKRKKTQKASEGNNQTNETSLKKGSFRSSSISFSLQGRSAIDIPNPIYTCDSQGKVVVNIVVNDYGEVIETSVNKRSSTTTNECLIDNALEYALGARFSQLPGRRTQPGTITYYFQD
ncbi:hypothetical protein [Salinimicrobium gaetbulicola]|uniref:TonB family protein n=1 Tax=Salinimicrobium gaetbulicola TaxID=999702 RepID=A0ABW3IIF3_9FLAO